jgi:hypothetical protein
MDKMKSIQDSERERPNLKWNKSRLELSFPSPQWTKRHIFQFAAVVSPNRMLPTQAICNRQSTIHKSPKLTLEDESIRDHSAKIPFAPVAKISNSIQMQWREAIHNGKSRIHKSLLPMTQTTREKAHRSSSTVTMGKQSL